ncbi:MAG: DNA-3-methyladenine glycosylase [Phycisphaerales bacterium]
MGGRRGGAVSERAKREFFARPAAEVARRLIGQRLVRVSAGVRLSGIIVETEAYVGVKDGASHAFNGRRTARNESMYGSPGTAYVYFTYGMHFCFNVSCAREGDPQAVLIRAVAAEEGTGVLRQNRGRAVSDSELCRGPGSLCRAMAINRELDGEALATSDRLWIDVERPRAHAASKLVRCPRIGIGESAGEWRGAPLRWYLRGAASVSVRDRSDRVLFGGRLAGRGSTA